MCEQRRETTWVMVDSATRAVSTGMTYDAQERERGRGPGKNKTGARTCHRMTSATGHGSDRTDDGPKRECAKPAKEVRARGVNHAGTHHNNAVSEATSKPVAHSF